MNPDPTELLTVAELAARWKVGRKRVMGLIDSGELPYVRFGLGPRTSRPGPQSIRVRACVAAEFLARVEVVAAEPDPAAKRAPRRGHQLSEGARRVAETFSW